MFDLQQALVVLDGKTLSFEELKANLKQIRMEHLEEVTPELNVNEMISMARKRSWLEENEVGQVLVHAGK